MKTVFVGLSGGVDSAVSAHLLKEEGYRAVGVFLKVWEPDFLPCTSGQDRLDAMRVAAHLNIPFETYNVEEEYKAGVIEYLLAEYKAGRTPNPDVMCNRAVKFGVFWDTAKKNGADFIATGHYAQNSEQGGARALLRGKDATKDQSYFLWTLMQQDLAHALFPVGRLEKSEVRRIAESVGLPNAAKKDSQGLCFLGHVDMKEFLERYIPVERGVVRSPEGSIVGEHEGVSFYTEGERFPLPGTDRMYVVGKDRAKNEITVAKEPVPQQAGAECQLREVNWVREEPQEGAVYSGQVQYHGAFHPVSVARSSGVWRATFDTSVLFSEGQSLVLYDERKEECLGGGIMAKS